MRLDFLKSRGWWAAASASVPFVYAVVDCLRTGAPIPMQTTVAFLGAWSAYFTVGEVRGRRDGTKSYVEVHRTLKLQQEQIAALRKAHE